MAGELLDLSPETVQMIHDAKQANMDARAADTEYTAAKDSTASVKAQAAASVQTAEDGETSARDKSQTAHVAAREKSIKALTAVQNELGLNDETAPPSGPGGPGDSGAPSAPTGFRKAAGRQSNR